MTCLQVETVIFDCATLLTLGCLVGGPAVHDWDLLQQDGLLLNVQDNWAAGRVSCDDMCCCTTCGKLAVAAVATLEEAPENNSDGEGVQKEKKVLFCAAQETDLKKSTTAYAHENVVISASSPSIADVQVPDITALVFRTLLPLWVQSLCVVRCRSSMPFLLLACKFGMRLPMQLGRKLCLLCAAARPALLDSLFL